MDFDVAARSWDQDPMKVERAVRVAGAILELTGPLDGKRALEYGCGTGLLGFALQPHLAHVTLADSSPGMLAVLREKIAATGAGNMEPLDLDVAKGPLPAARFDLLFTLMVLHHVPDIDGALRAFHSLLEPGGRLCISDLDTEDGSFHGPKADVHRGFDRRDLAGRLERAGFRNPRFTTPYVVKLEKPAGTASYPLFLVVAERG